MITLYPAALTTENNSKETPLHYAILNTTPQAAAIVALMIQAVPEMLIYKPDTLGSGTTLVSHLATKAADPAILGVLLKVIPTAIWAVENETPYQRMRSFIGHVRFAVETAWRLLWAPSLQIHSWMPPLFKRAVQMLLMLKPRRNEGRGPLAMLPDGIKLMIIKWLASLSVQPPYLRMPWEAARRAMDQEMKQNTKYTVTAAAQSVANGNLRVTATKLGVMLKAKSEDKACPLLTELEQELCQDIHQCIEPADWQRRRQLYIWMLAYCEKQHCRTYIVVPPAFAADESAIFQQALVVAKEEYHSYLSFVEQTLCVNAQLIHIQPDSYRFEHNCS
jgi:hypothetical protein